MLVVHFLNVFSDLKGWRNLRIKCDHSFKYLIYCLHWWTISRQCLAWCSLPAWKKAANVSPTTECVCRSAQQKNHLRSGSLWQSCFARALWKLSRESGSEGTSYYESHILLSAKVHNNTRLAHIAVAQESPDMQHSYVEALITAVV